MVCLYRIITSLPSFFILQTNIYYPNIDTDNEVSQNTVGAGLICVGTLLNIEYRLPSIT